MQRKLTYGILGFVFVLLIAGGLFWVNRRTSEKQINTPNIENAEYNPAINPNDFVSQVNNRYFTLVPGMKYEYRSQTSEGTERTEIAVTNEKNNVMGVSTTVVSDKVFLNNELIEDTKDWYAQDSQGNVWYFGEEVDNYENGKLKDHEGSWSAGIDGAKPGIIMLANPKIGDLYRQEYYKNEAEDMGEVVAINKKVTVPYGTFDNCIQTRDWSQIEKTLNENKYYCSDLGFLVLEHPVDKNNEKTELVEISTK